jgi:hypothetical protein
MRVVKSPVGGTVTSYPSYNNMPAVSLPAAEVLGVRTAQKRPWWYSDNTAEWEAGRAAELERARQNYMAGYNYMDPMSTGRVETDNTLIDLTPAGDIQPIVEAIQAWDEGLIPGSLSTAIALASIIAPFKIQGPLGNKGTEISSRVAIPRSVQEQAPNPYINVVDRIDLEMRSGRNDGTGSFMDNLNPRSILTPRNGSYSPEFAEWLVPALERRMQSPSVQKELARYGDLTSETHSQLTHMLGLDYLDEFQTQPMRMYRINEAIQKLAERPAFPSKDRSENAAMIQEAFHDLGYNLRRNGQILPYETARTYVNEEMQAINPFITAMVDRYRNTGLLQPEEMPLTSRLLTNINEVAHGKYFDPVNNSEMSQEFLDRFSQALNAGEGFNLGQIPVYRGLQRTPKANRPSSSFSSDMSVATGFGKNLLAGNTRPDESVLIPNMFMDPAFKYESEVMRDPFARYGIELLGEPMHLGINENNIAKELMLGKDLPKVSSYLTSDPKNIYRLINE